MCMIYKFILFQFPGSCTIEINISIDPDRKTSEMVILQSSHIRQMFHVKLVNPCLIIQKRIKNFCSANIIIYRRKSHIFRNFCLFNRFVLYKNIIVNPVITMKYRHKSSHFRFMSYMIGRITTFNYTICYIIRPTTNSGQCSQKEVMY